MDDSLAKGLTKRFFRELEQETEERFRRLPVNLLAGKKVSLKNWERFEKAFVKLVSPVSLDVVKFGSKKNRKIGWTGFLPLKKNIAQDRKENVLYGYQRIYSFDGVFDEPTVNWSVSHHLIRRFFQRGAKSTEITSATMMDILFSELRYVSFWANVLYEQIFLGEELVEGTSFEKARFIIPSKSGYFVAVWTRPCLSLKTFIGLDTALPEELALREKMIALGNLFSPYYLHYRSRDYDHGDDVNNLLGDEFVVYSEMILSCFVNNGFLSNYIERIAPHDASSEELRRYKKALSPHLLEFTEDVTADFSRVCEKYSFIDAVSKTKPKIFLSLKENEAHFLASDMIKAN